ncbi:MAG: hypothetical protein ACKVQU_35945 [Burkholderiales bacterium]
MAKPNYAFAKRQRDLAQKQKKEEKRKKKAESQLERPADDPLQPGVEGASAPEPTSGAVDVKP